MIIVAYEVHDYRAMKKDEDQPNNEKKKRKWLILDREPTTSEIFCFMTCFVGLFTGKLVLSIDILNNFKKNEY